MPGSEAYSNDRPAELTALVAASGHTEQDASTILEALRAEGWTLCCEPVPDGLLRAFMLPMAQSGSRYFVRGFPSGRGWRTKSDVRAWMLNRSDVAWTGKSSFRVRGDDVTHVVVGRDGREASVW